MSTTALKKTKLAMVDLDNTLVFTMRANYEAYKRALGEHGFDFTFEQYAGDCDGKSYRSFLPGLVGGSAELTEAVHDRKIELYPECLTLAELNVPLADILRALRNEYYIALVTTATRRNVERILEHFELTELFDAVVTNEDVLHSKPDPYCYNMVIERFGVDRRSCIIFEDSPTGIAAACASGCQTFCVKGGDRL